MAFLALNEQRIVLGDNTISLGGPTVVEWTPQDVQAETWIGASNSAGMWSKQTLPTVDWN